MSSVSATFFLFLRRALRSILEKGKLQTWTTGYNIQGCVQLLRCTSLMVSGGLTLKNDVELPYRTSVGMLRKHSELEALNLPHGHSPRKRPPQQIRKSITKKRKPTLANKTRGMYIRLRWNQGIPAENPAWSSGWCIRTFACCFRV